MKPVRPALGLEPRPVAPSSRISPPAPVAAPGNGEIAVGWLWVSTFISTCAVLVRARCSTGALVKPAAAPKRSTWAALHHRGVVAVGHHRALRADSCCGVADHLEHRVLLRHAVDGEARR